MTLADATAVVTAVRAVLTAQQAWQGTATELLAAADGTLALPGNARAMAAHLRSVAPLLRKSGIQVSFVRSGQILLQKPLMLSPNSDSVRVM